MERSTLEKMTRPELVEHNQPRESAVAGHLLRAFESEWPTGYSWPVESPYLVDPEDAVEWAAGDAPALLVDSQVYDVRSWELEYLGHTGWGNKSVAFWAVFKPWLDRRAAK